MTQLSAFQTHNAHKRSLRAIGRLPKLGSRLIQMSAITITALTLLLNTKYTHKKQLLAIIYTWKCGREFSRIVVHLRAE